VAATPRGESPHWAPIRRLVLFVLGVTTIVDALVGTPQHLGQLVVGAILVGIIPVDELLSALSRGR
jgi:hypothetical protein